VISRIPRIGAWAGLGALPAHPVEHLADEPEGVHLVVVLAGR
jgi:hypothetical protein